MAGEAARRAENQNPKWASYPALFAASSLSLPANPVIGLSSISHRHFSILDCRNLLPTKLCGWDRQALGLGGPEGGFKPGSHFLNLVMVGGSVHRKWKDVTGWVQRTSPSFSLHFPAEEQEYCGTGGASLYLDILYPCAVYQYGCLPVCLKSRAKSQRVFT